MATVYPPLNVPDDDLWDAVVDAFSTQEAHVLAWLGQPPQTNEVRHMAGILPALAVIAASNARPVELLELGCSGRLNLRADHFRMNLPQGAIGPEAAGVQQTPEWTGAMPSFCLPVAARRAGVDLNPLDPCNEKDRTRLLTYV